MAERIPPGGWISANPARDTHGGNFFQPSQLGVMAVLDGTRAGARLNRLRKMTFDECAWRAGVVAHRTADRLRVRLLTPHWSRAGIEQALAPQLLDKEMRRAIAQGDWRGVHDTLANRLRQGSGRWALDPSAAEDVRDAVVSRWPSAPSDAAARADRILEERYDLLGYRDLSFAAASPRSGTHTRDVDWHFDPVHHRRAPAVCWADVPYLDPAIGDHKIIWELNRHQHWLRLGRASWLTGRPQYAGAIIEQLESWLSANPPLVGVNWASMLEIGFRAISWTWALQFLLADTARQPNVSAPIALSGDATLPAHQEPWLVDMLVALDRQLTHVEQHLSSYFSPNTHLTGEALALYVVGHALPELAASARWRATGRRILLEEIGKQILADGGHAERSTHYQRYTLDFYLLALITAERAGDTGAIAAFTDAVTRLAAFTRAMADDRGRLPLIGDDDGGMLWPIIGRECRDVRDSLAIAALALEQPDLAPWGVTEEAFWIVPRMAIERAPRLEAPRLDEPAQTSRALLETGYVVARDASGGHAVFDVGDHGYMNGGHAHADALSLTLSVSHHPLLIDPGTSTYTMNPRLRDRMRATTSHNTITVDGESQSDPAGPFHWRTRANGRLHASRHTAGLDWAEATHDGYAAIEHRRSIVRAESAGWLVVDELLPSSESASVDLHSAAMHWHFDPAWMVRPDGQRRLRATHADGDEAWLLHDGGERLLLRGDDTSGLGWCAPVYGTLVPTWTARVTHKGVAPFSMVTWIGDSAATAHGEPILNRIVATPDPAGRAIAARLVTGDHASVFLLRPGEPASRIGRTCEVSDYQTDARVLHIRTSGRDLLSLDLVDASRALALRDGWISVEMDEPVSDLHLTLSDGCLDLSASEPPRQLRVHGACLASLRAIRLNGRPSQPAPGDQPYSLVIRADSWAARPLVHYGATFAL